jgi:hypothetical protein
MAGTLYISMDAKVIFNINSSYKVLSVGPAFLSIWINNRDFTVAAIFKFITLCSH